MLERILNMLKKEFIQLFRDPKMRPVIFVMPIVQLVIFGYAATTDIRNVATAVYDMDNTVASRDLVAGFVQSKYFKVVAYIDSDEQARDLIDHGRAQVVLRMNKGFSEGLASGRTAQLQMIIDGTDSNTARIVLDYGSRIAGQFSHRILVGRSLRMQGQSPPEPFELRSRAWFNENLESRNYYVPGVIAMLVLITVLMLTSMAVVREKEIGTIEQIMVTPIRPYEFILGKSVPFALIGFFDVFLISLVGVYWFHVPILGSKLLLLGATALYLMTAIGAGLLISTVVRSQQQALMTTFFFSFPAILLSGFMFPIANMPTVVQWLTVVNPLRYYIVVIRGIFLKGVGVDILWPQLLALLIIGTITLTLAVKRFHKTMA